MVCACSMRMPWLTIEPLTQPCTVAVSGMESVLEALLKLPRIAGLKALPKLAQEAAQASVREGRRNRDGMNTANYGTPLVAPVLAATGPESVEPDTARVRSKRLTPRGLAPPPMSDDDITEAKALSTHRAAIAAAVPADPISLTGTTLGTGRKPSPYDDLDAATIAQLTQQLQQANAELSSTLATLHRAKDQLVHSEKLAALGRMVAGAAHELNNPLSSIAIYGDALEKRLRGAGSGFAADAEQAHRICEGAERIQRLTRDLMNYGRTSGEVEAVELGPLVRQALGFCDPLLRQAGVAVRYTCEEGLPVVSAVRTQLQQVVVQVQEVWFKGQEANQLMQLAASQLM